MTSVRIDTRSGWLNGRQPAMIQAAQQALSEAFRVLDIASDVILQEHDATRFAAPPEASARFTRVEVQTLPVAHAGIKHRLYRALVAGFGELGVDGTEIKIVIIEVAHENWGIDGGRPASDVLTIEPPNLGP